MSASVQAVTITSSSEGHFAEPTEPLRQFPDPPAEAYFNFDATKFFWGGLEVSPGVVKTPLDNDISNDYTDYTSWFHFGASFIDGQTYTHPTGDSIGTFTYFNGNSSAGTGAKFIDLVLSLDIDGEPLPIDVSFPLEVKNISNSTVLPDGRDGDVSAPENADIVRFSNRSVLIPGLGKYLNLSFLPDVTPTPVHGFPEETEGNAFSVLELESWQAELIATITDSPLAPIPDTPGVPDAGSTLALIVTAFASLETLRRRKVAYES